MPSNGRLSDWLYRTAQDRLRAEYVAACDQDDTTPDTTPDTVRGSGVPQPASDCPGVDGYRVGTGELWSALAEGMVRQ